MRAARVAALGALHGPAELLPVSSSAHVTLVPWLAGWDEGTGAAPATRKALEVLLHAGTGAGLLWLLRHDAAWALRALDRRRVAFHVCAVAPPAAMGALLERVIEERLGTPAVMAAGLAAGALALVAAEARPGGAAGGTADRGRWPAAAPRTGRQGRDGRPREDAGPLDGLALGLGQALALAPGVSRRGMTLAAARRRGYARADASALSWEVALPVLVAATARKGWGLVRTPPASGDRAALAAGAGAALAATLASAPLLTAVERLPWWPWAAWRVALAAAVVRRLRQDASR